MFAAIPEFWTAEWLQSHRGFVVSVLLGLALLCLRVRRILPLGSSARPSPKSDGHRPAP
jgi:hypothetical protein